MTRRELVHALTSAGSREAEVEARIILEELFGVPYSAQLISPDRDYSSDALDSIINKRKESIPLQYLLGYAYFRNEKYLLNQDCLIPRADTELLVEKAVELLPPRAVFADLCTGSGCVAISTLCARKDTQARALDISEGAVAMAQKNAELNGVADRMEITAADVFSLPLGENKYDAVISNPPYIQRKDLASLSPEVLCEPMRALDGGEDGMDFYRFITKNYKQNLKDGGFFAFEIGYDQEHSIKEVASASDMTCEVFCDLSKNPRIAILKHRN